MEVKQKLLDEIKAYLQKVSEDNTSGALINMNYVFDVVHRSHQDIMALGGDDFLDESPCEDGYLCNEEDAWYIIQLIRASHSQKQHKLIIVRGISGSGKTTFVKKYFPDANHFEADMYFYDEEGNYNWNPSKLGNAHGWCKHKTLESLQRGIVTVVSNTFIKRKELTPYLKMAEDLGVDVEVYRMVTEYDNTHNVPKEVIEKMKQNIIDYEGEILVGYDYTHEG